ncbi:brevican core protein-like [Biomphalaria glabrata]|uniref:Brevican core protein-like n=1 Tax=Biomphalaria glabrata TaxID=6526 RepID=A0A9W3B8B6_BIOGL|nr:brevican core protein-like [Biomphalaria glabrata]KAI8757185.1 C-type lectin domain family 4 member M-like; partial [Biomphalaria glabrata]
MRQIQLYQFSSFLSLGYLGLIVQVRSDYFYKVEKSNSVMQYSTTILQVTSLLDCSRKCQLQKCACFSYSNYVCSIGKCNLTNNNLGSSQEIYVSCLNSIGFNFITIGSVRACVWMSSNSTDYITARDDCRGKDAHLYTVKTMDRLKWLQTYYPKTSIWIGLNDMVVEGILLWEDDNSVCNSSCISQYFNAGEPTNSKYLTPDGEDCITYYLNLPLLNDVTCSLTYVYICEKPFF